MSPEQTIAYRRPWPRSKVAQGVMIDDQVTAAIAPRAQPHAGESADEARRVFERTLEAYAHVGLTDVPKKRKDDVAEAVVWVVKCAVEQVGLGLLALNGARLRLLP